MKIIIIGAGAAGSTAALELRKLDKNAEIILIDKEKKGYSPCALPYVIAGDIKEKEIFVIDEKEYSSNNIKRIFDKVKRIDRKNKKIILKKEQEIKYDKVIITTGSKTIIPNIKGLDNAEYFTLKTIEDERKIREKAKKGKNAIIIGGGWTSIELAEALEKKGMKIKIIEMKERIISTMIDKEITEEITKILEQKKIEIITNCQTKEITAKKIITNKGDYAYDLLIVSCGVLPNIELAKISGVKTRKGIIINEYMQTSDKNIYSCGDCVELENFITKEKEPAMLGSIAVRSAGTIARNITNTKKEKFDGAILSAITKIYDTFLGRTGITEETAKEKKIKNISSIYRGWSKPEYCPEKKEIMIKMIADLRGKIIGLQIIGKEDIASRVNMIATAISKEMDLNELMKVETCYDPMSSPIFEPLLIAATHCNRKLKELKK